VLLKARVDDGPIPDDDQLRRVLARLPGSDKRLTGGGADFTIWTWIDAPDAATASVRCAAMLRDAARSEGVSSLRFIRAHAASVEGRSSPYRGVAGRLQATDEWSVYFRLEPPSGDGRVDADVLRRFGEVLGKPDTNITLRGDQEKFLLDDGSGFTARFWASGDTLAEAIRDARRDVLAALAAAGMAGWRLVRLQAATAGMRHGDSFPGLATRSPRPTEEQL
jgi:hypothetical protein